MKRIDMTNVKEAGDFERVPAGPYICKICDVIDFPDKEYLKVIYDIDEGEYKGYYSELRKNHPDWEWSGAYVKSYKQKALPMFKRFCSAVSQSNGNYVFDGGDSNPDETTLRGKTLGIVFQEEEYYGNDGNKRTRLVVFKEFPVHKFADQKIPKPKLTDDGLQRSTANTAAASTNDEFMKIPEGYDTESPFK